MKDLTLGKPFKTIAYFALPMFIGNIFQILYTLFDGNIVGVILGDNATSAIGATVSLSTMIIGFATGLGGGFALLVARHFGAKNYEKVRQSIASIYFLSLIIISILTIITLISLRQILSWMNTNEQFYHLSYRYLSIIIGGMMFTFFYNILAGILRAIGDSITPIIFLVVTTLLNIGLDYLFLLIFKWQIEGVAIATILSQAISALSCFIYLYVKYSMIRVSKKDFTLDKNDVTEMLKYGFTNGIINFVIQIGSVSIQWSVNTLGYTTAQAAARKIDDCFMSPFGSIATATATFVSQNYGAKRYDRIKKGLYCGFIMGFIYSAFIMILTYAACKQLIFFFTNLQDQQIIQDATNYLYFNLAFYPVLALLFILRSALQAYGHKLSPIFGGLIEMGIKIIIVITFVPTLGYLGIIISEPIIWCLSVALMLYVMFKSFKNFNNVSLKKA